MNDLIEKYIKETDEASDIQNQWELLKITIRDYTIDYSKLKNINRAKEVNRLYDELNNYDTILANTPDSKEILNKRDQVKLKLELYEQSKARAAQIRARINWIEKGEKNTSFFLNLEKGKANSKIMSSLKEEDGTIKTNQKDIMKIQRNHFISLYKKKIESGNMNNRIDAFLDNVNIPQLSEESKLRCEGLITTDELLNALKLMKNGSSPGNDGITIEFIKMFWSRLGKLLTKLFNLSFQKGKLASSQRNAIITLIHKGKDLPRDELKHWRPISLLNSDYKLLAKCLALRMSSVVTEIINEDQVGYIKGRQVSTLLRLIDDVTDQMNIKNEPGLLVAIDYTRAFDTISKDFMLACFSKFGFGPQFIRWVKTLMCDSRSCVSYLGWLSDFFLV
jgi:hypothetical protein